MFKILLVDDDADVRRMVKKILDRGGYNVVVVDNGLTAINELNTSHYDMLISDANMPQYTGFDLIRTLRRNPKHKDLIIAMLTGRREKQDIEQAIELGVRDYFIKPIDPELLLQKIQKLFEGQMISPAVVSIKESANVDFSASLQSPLKMKQIGLSGFIATSPIPLPVGMEFYLNIDDMDYENMPKAKVSMNTLDAAKKIFTIEGIFVEMDQEFRSQIKKCLEKYNAA